MPASIRHPAPDPRDPGTPPAAHAFGPGDLRGHPVVELLAGRAGSASRPGARADEHVLALAIEGGGMRGVVSAGMTAALDALGLQRAFDLVVGVSAGASNGFGLLAGIGSGVAETYLEGCTDGRFIDVRRGLLRRGPVMDLDHLLDDLVLGRGDERVEALLATGVRFAVVATDVQSTRSATLAGMGSRAELRAALKASSMVPGIAGERASFRGRDYVDGTVAESIPHRAAIAAGATHVLALQTRPFGVSLRPPSLPERVLVHRALRRANPALVDRYTGRPQRYTAAVEELAARTADGSGPPFLATIRPRAGTPPVRHLEQQRAPLLAGA
ncbi:MAG TPA: patatin-like phospholipase family protein, partial [Solirubrobacteraceae bacterium]